MGQLEARSSFFAAGRRVVRGGTIVEDTDPVVTGREQLFVPVEQATAAPGEVRHVERSCDVEGCEYTGTVRGLKMHTTRVHG